MFRSIQFVNNRRANQKKNAIFQWPFLLAFAQFLLWLARCRLAASKSRQETRCGRRTHFLVFHPRWESFRFTTFIMQTICNFSGNLLNWITMDFYTFSYTFTVSVTPKDSERRVTSGSSSINCVDGRGVIATLQTKPKGDPKYEGNKSNSCTFSRTW